MQAGAVDQQIDASLRPPRRGCQAISANTQQNHDGSMTADSTRSTGSGIHAGQATAGGRSMPVIHVKNVKNADTTATALPAAAATASWPRPL
jgi:hypothetical protein